MSKRRNQDSVFKERVAPKGEQTVREQAITGPFLDQSISVGQSCFA